MTFENFIPPRSKNVLEITGEVSADFETTKEKFLEIQPICNYTMSKNLPTTNKKFEVVLIQSAVIGTLPNTELVKFIKNAVKLLNSRGRLVFILDNMGYVENIMAILKGNPPKFKVTLSKVELEEAIQQAGLNSFNFMNAARRIGIERGVAEIAKIDMSVFAYIISATVEKLPPSTSIQIAMGEQLVCGAKRIFDPQHFVATEPNISNFFHGENQGYRIFKAEEFKNRIFINQRITAASFAEGKNFFEKMRQTGYLYIDEMDDNPNRWEREYSQTGYINFIGVHAIQTSTEYLADYFRQFNPNVKVFANQLRRILPLRDFKKQKKSPVRIFFGALNRDEEFQDILPILNEFAQRYGEKLEFKIIANKELFDALNTKSKILVGDPNYYNGQFVPYEKYEETLQESDIALLPLLDNEFNRSKSDLKFIECAGCGAVVLASPVVYSSVIKEGETGFIFKDKKEFAQKLQLLIENHEKRYAVATAAYKYVKHNRLLSQHYMERLDWYNELFEKLDELNAETQARIDKIAPNFANEQVQIEGKNRSGEEIIIPDTW